MIDYKKEQALIEKYHHFVFCLAKHYYKKYRLKYSLIDYYDILQETCIVIILKSRKGQYFNKKYISKIVQTKTIDMIRKENGRGKNNPVFLELFEEGEQNGYSYDPWKKINNKIMADKILNQIYYSDTFDFDNKLLFYLNYYQDMSQDEIGDCLKLAQSTISNKIKPVMDYIKEFNICLKV